MTESVTNILTDQRPRLETAIGLLETRLNRAPCDHTSMHACIRCSTLYLTKTLRDLFQAMAEPTKPDKETNGQ